MAIDNIKYYSILPRVLSILPQNEEGWSLATLFSKNVGLEIRR